MKKLLSVAAIVLLSALLFSACGGGGGGGGGGGAIVPPAKTSVKLAKTGQVISYATGSVGDDGALQAGVAWPVSRFTAISTGSGTVVSDNLTGLMWLQDANCANTIAYNPDSTGNGSVTWQHALDFVKGINDGTYSNCGAGYTDWRLPNRKELRSLVDYSQYNPALQSGHPFSNVQVDVYWSSTTYADDTSKAWSVRMYGGDVYYDAKSVSGDYVWPVRSGQ
jgi:hypothetical protein